jgi:Lysyl oxidase
MVRRFGGGILAVGALVVLCLTTSVSAALGANRLPDLVMARPTNLTLDKSTIPGHELLRYSAVVANIGAGAFEIAGERPNTSSSMSVYQRIYTDTGSSSLVYLPNATMFYAGDGHNHWHLGNLESGTLTRLDNGSQVGSLAKHGFCFSDNVIYDPSLPGAPNSNYYGSSSTPTCARFNPTALSVVEGLSVGWGDLYSYSTAFQYIDVTGLQNGHYRLTDSVDEAQLGLIESNGANDSSYVDINLKTNSVSVRRG